MKLELFNEPSKRHFLQLILIILQILEEKPIHTLSMSGMGTMGPGPPLAGLATLGLAPPTAKEWDQMSMYSQHSQHSRRHDHVPRSRMYQMDRPGE